MPFLAPPTGFAGWLFQAAWAPQHLMAASCVVAAMLLIARYAQQQGVLLLLTLVLVVVAGFESSTYVGGITFAIAALAAAPLLLVAVEPGRRLQFFVGMAAAAVLVVCLAAPFLNNQLMAVAARGDNDPIVLRHFAVLGAMFPAALRRALDWPAYWLLLLPIELPATYVAGVIALVAMLRSGAPPPEKLATAVLACLAAAGLLASWLLASTLGDNNDLGLRAVLPAASVLIAAAAAGSVLLPRRAVIAATAIGGLILSLPDTAAMIRSNVEGTPAPDGTVFAQAPELWQAVRRYAAPTARVANNPLFLQDLTPWPANISWALLADRSSCFAGRELALALAPLSDSRREAINAQFVRVFAGEGTAGDLSDMAKKYACDVVVVVPQDKAWNNDPFAASADYRLAENRDGRWRIYVAIKADAAVR
jgi:CDP-diglyceride synthetase